MQALHGTSSTAVPTLPRPWQAEASFHDALYDWMGRAPWLAISFVAHLLLYFVLAAIAGSDLEHEQPPTIVAELITPPEQVFLPPEEEELVEPTPVEVEEPRIVETDVPVEAAAEVEAEADRPSPDRPWDAFADAAAIGIGGAPGGGGKLAGRVPGGGGAPGNFEPALRAGLEWLAAHQSADGSWSPDGFMSECDHPPPHATGEGNPVHRVGVTALALLAFMGFGDTLNEGDYARNLRRGVAWLCERQDAETGCIGERSSVEWIYDHALATLALAEAHHGAPNPLLRARAQRAVDFCARARAEYGAWRYAAPSRGDADSSVTGWMVLALGAAQDAGLRVDRRALEDALAFVDEVTDDTGRTGYRSAGEGSSRPRHLLEVYPARSTEALTAVGLASRVFVAAALGRGLDEVAGPAGAGRGDRIELGVERLLGALPEWPRELLPTPSDLEPEGSGALDMYYWYYGSYALFQLSDRYPRAWREWEAALERAVLPSQRRSPPCFEGSWDPLGVWGEEGGRVYSTAIMALCLEVHFRYGKVFGTR